MSLLAEAERVKSKKEKLEKKRKPISKVQRNQPRSKQQEKRGNSDYTEFDNFTKWLGVNQ
ncbi:unnamed protein product [Arabis nemorensis]|uniref:Uncharacterized protein n=1 Tax=Arabis nemorensis TaxID=586526 RepID=A0A565C966_9BRAS|nr:unnamed protein product [Arabis nemorensis]